MISCQTLRLSPSQQKLQVRFSYLARAFVGRKVSDVIDRRTPVCQREWLEAIRLKRVDIV